MFSEDTAEKQEKNQGKNQTAGSDMIRFAPDNPCEYTAKKPQINKRLKSNLTVEIK